MTTSVYLREYAYACKQILAYLRGAIRGENPSGQIVTPDRLSVAKGTDELRIEWLRFPAVGQAVDEVIRSLDIALRWFNIKQLAVLLDRVGREAYWEEFSLIKDLPECRVGGEIFSLQKQCRVVDNHCYITGRSALLVGSAQAYDQLVVATRPSPRLTRYLSLEGKEVRLLTEARISGKTPDIPDGEEDRTEQTDPSDVMTLTPGGIWTPKK